MLKSYLMKTITAPITYVCLLATTFIFLIRFFYNNDGIDVINMVDITLDLDGMRKIILIFAAAPFNAVFCSEIQNKITNYIIIRHAAKKYIINHIMMCIFTSFFLTFVGSVISMGIMCLSKPFYIPYEGEGVPMPYGVLLESIFPAGYSIIRIFIFSFSNAMWAVSGLAVSAVIPNAFVAICVPYIFSYVLEKITMNLPDCFNLYLLTLSRNILDKGIIITLLYTILIFGIITFLFSIVFNFFADRRIKNEIV